MLPDMFFTLQLAVVFCFLGASLPEGTYNFTVSSAWEKKPTGTTGLGPVLVLGSRSQVAVRRSGETEVGGGQVETVLVEDSA